MGSTFVRAVRAGERAKHFRPIYRRARARGCHPPDRAAHGSRASGLSGCCGRRRFGIIPNWPVSAG